MNELEMAQLRVIHGTFVRTADENYLISRQCFFQNFFSEFQWLGLHAIEKYMKAILLANGLSTKDYRHNVVKLFDQIASEFPCLLPKNIFLQSEAALPRSRIFRETLVKINQEWSADSRYGLYSTSCSREDLFIVDKMVFFLRRAILPLRRKIANDIPTDDSTLTYLDWLQNNPDQIWASTGRLFEFAEHANAAIRHALLNCNFPFAHPNYRHRNTGVIVSMRSGAVQNDVVEALQSDNPEWIFDGIQLADWMIDNIELNKSDKKTLVELTLIAKQKLDKATA